VAVHARERAWVALTGAQHETAHEILKVLAPALGLLDGRALLRIGREQRPLRLELVERP